MVLNKWKVVLKKYTVDLHTALATLTNGKLIRKCKEVEDIILDMVVLEVVHHVCAITFDLLVGGHSTEHNLSEALRGEHPEADASYGPVVLDKC